MTKPLHPLNSKKAYDITREDWRSLELDYKLADLYAGELPEQKLILENSKKNGLPEIHVGPFEGHLLMMLLRLMGAKRGVEVGTLGGYSSSWICRALEGQGEAQLHCLELKEDFAKIAAQNLSPWKELVKIHIGAAKDTLSHALSAERDLDFVFIDADKAGYPDYFDWAWEHLRVGGLILMDNFYLWGGVSFAGEENSALRKDFMQRATKGESFTEAQWQGMNKLWMKLKELGPSANKTILPTSEGLGLVHKLK